MAVNQHKIQTAVQMILEAIGEDISREGLAETPKRVARFWADFADYDPGNTATVFTHNGKYNQMVAVTGMKVWSLCEHHLLPFWCHVNVAYIPNGKAIGLSKIARIAHDKAHALQMQERLAEQIAEAVSNAAQCNDVAVLVAGEHTCMTIRGIKTEGLMTSSALRGAFRENHETRSEFMQIVYGGRR